MSIRVLAIDDEDDVLRLIRIKLEREGFEVMTASNGEEGVEKVLAEKPDIVIVDVMMPKKDGYQVIKEVREELGSEAPPAIILSVRGGETDIAQGLAAGAVDYITKPFSPSELVERINVALIRSGRTLSPSQA
ncbi:MAG: response regulator transcription factor [Euryarchaeota archaeon]|nr:response regulator transcription factor [Euryarchaeota archaeon]